MRSVRLAIATMIVVASACTLTGTASAPQYVCAAQNASGEHITCSAPDESYPGDGCRCAITAKGSHGPEMFFGRVVQQ